VRTPGSSLRVADLTQLFASFLAENYTKAVSEKPNFQGSLPIRKLRQVEDHVSEHLAGEISVQALAEVVTLSRFHFCRVFKQATGMSPPQFVRRQRMAHAQRLMRETSRNLIEIAVEVGYANSSHFAQVFRRVVGVTPTEFRHAL
jgi:AraC family transcriptional regulator